jgi:putative transposase
MQNRGRPFDVGSCSHPDLDTAETRSVQVVGYIKGKSAIHLARTYGERKQNYVGQHFWARGFLVSTVGKDETVIREYIRNQEVEDERLDQLNLWK